MMVSSYRKKPGETYMCERQKQYFRQKLLAWRQNLLDSAEHYKRYMHDNHVNYSDELDAASQAFEERVELKARDRERKLLAKIQKTLEDITQGDYGYCVDCGNEIGVKRLDARPTATRCIDCKMIAEDFEKRVGKGLPELVDA